MDLKTFFKRYNITNIQKVAERAGTTLAYLQQCRYGNRRLSADLAVRLEWASGGVLTAHELRPDLPWPCSADSQTLMPVERLLSG